MKKLSDIREEVANITVDPRNRIKKPADQNKHAMAIAKNAKRMGLKSAMMGKHVRVSGNKKAVNDFLRITIGKSSYGDPTEKDMTTPQIDKMLNKGLKEKSYGAGEEGTDELKKKYKKDTPMESLEENAIPKIKQIVAKKQAMKIDGVMVDMFTASAISQIYDKVNDANKKKMEKMKVTQLANAAMKLMQRNSVSEGLWDNIRAKRARGEKMRKKGEKGAPTQDQIKRAQGEEVEEAMSTGDAISKLFKTKNKKEIDGIANLMNMTSVKVLQSMMKQNPKGFKRMTAKMGELPAMESVIKEGGHNDVESMKNKVKTAMSALQKMNTELGKLGDEDSLPTWWTNKVAVSVDNLDGMADYIDTQVEGAKDKAFRDFRKAGGGRKRGVDPADQDIKATDDDRKAASKNIIMQLRRVSDLPRGGKVEFENGKTINVTKKDALKIGKVFDTLRKPQDKAKFQAMIYKSPADMKKVLSKLP